MTPLRFFSLLSFLQHLWSPLDSYVIRNSNRQDREMDINLYFLERRAFEQFVNEPLSAYTIGLLKFAMKPFLIRLQIYGSIPEDKWSLYVEHVVRDAVMEHEREIIFLPLIEQTMPIFEFIIEQKPTAFKSTFEYLAKSSTYEKLNEDQRKIRDAIISAYIKKSKIKVFFDNMNEEHRKMIKRNKKQYVKRTKRPDWKIYYKNK
jgi:hypothetical protein